MMADIWSIFEEDNRLSGGAAPYQSRPEGLRRAIPLGVVVVVVAVGDWGRGGANHVSRGAPLQSGSEGPV